MGAEYSFCMKSIETHARAFLALIILGIGTVYTDEWRIYSIHRFPTLRTIFVFCFKLCYAESSNAEFPPLVETALGRD